MTPFLAVPAVPVRRKARLTVRMALDSRARCLIHTGIAHVRAIRVRSLPRLDSQQVLCIVRNEFFGLQVHEMFVLTVFGASVSIRAPVIFRRARGLRDEDIDESVRRNPSIAPNTQRAYADALYRLREWLDKSAARLDDASLAGYVGNLFERGLTMASAAMAVKAVRFLARARGQPCPDGPITDAALKRFRRRAGSCGRGRAEPLTVDEAESILATAPTRRRYSDGRRESVARASRRSLVDMALVSVLFLGALRRAEAAMLTWGDIDRAADGQGVVIRVRFSKTNPDGFDPDVRYVNGPFADAIGRLRKETGGDRHPGRRVFGGLTGASLSRRLSNAATAAGVATRITAHSGRFGLAVELTRRGASTHDVMHAGHWKSVAMVAHYSAAAQAEIGAVARYMPSEWGATGPRRSLAHQPKWELNLRRQLGVDCQASMCAQLDRII